MKKIMKKILLSVIVLFAFTSCGLLDILDSGPQVSTVNSPSSFTSAQKRIAIVNGTDFIRRKVSDQLSKDGWKVSGAITGKETFAIYFDKYDVSKETNHYGKDYYDSNGFYRGVQSVTETREVTHGYVSIYDLRTNERLYVYDFDDKSEKEIVQGVLAAVEKLEENMR